MYVITARNVNDAVALALPYLISEGIEETSRNGTVLTAPTPVMTVYNKPAERVLFGELRDANPFFHLMEALWMLNGRNDLAFPMYFNKNFASYSDDGETVHGAYGHRWRKNFGYDQLQVIIEELRRNPNSRRCVLSMWDASAKCNFGADDLYKAVSGGKDVPCNTAAYFDLRGGVLNMTVLNRSNDVIWGAYGANAVHFSVLQEYIAFAVGAPVGVYRQFSNNFHVYTGIYDIYKLSQIAEESKVHNYYREDRVKPHPLISTDLETWNKDLVNFMWNPVDGAELVDPFFKDVVKPMYMAWYRRKEKLGTGLTSILTVQAEDWRTACIQWISRRERSTYV